MSRGSQRDSPATVGLLCQTENVVNRKLPGSSRHKPKVAFPITVSVVDPVLPLDAKALHDIINATSSSKKMKEPAQCMSMDGACGIPDTPSDAIPPADLALPTVFACHTCPGLDDQTLFPENVIENIVTANMEARRLLRLLKSPSSCGNFDKMSQIHAFIERFINLTDICSPAARATGKKTRNDPR